MKIPYHFGQEWIEGFISLSQKIFFKKQKGSMECQFLVWSGKKKKGDLGSSFLSKFSAPNLTNHCFLYLKGVQFSIEWSKIWEWYSQYALESYHF